MSVQVTDRELAKNVSVRSTNGALFSAVGRANAVHARVPAWSFGAVTAPGAVSSLQTRSPPSGTRHSRTGTPLLPSFRVIVEDDVPRAVGVEGDQRLPLRRGWI